MPRRSFLGGFALGAQALVGGSAYALSARVPEAMRTPGRADQAYGQPSVHEQGVLRTEHQPAGFAVWRTPLQHHRGTITASGLHFAVHHSGIPDIDPGAHELKIHGLVRKPLRFSLDRLMRYPMVSRVLFIECAGNSAANALSPFAQDISVGELSGEVSCSEWTGVPLSCLLQEAGVRPEARWVITEGADAASHARSLPLAPLLEEGMVALYQNGERIRPSQGYPMRLLLPGAEGNVNVKWLHRLQLSERPAYTKDESGMYAQALADGRVAHFDFIMPVKSVITRPSGRQILKDPQGFFEIEGLAWSGHGRIAQVEVSTDAGAHWAPARLREPVLDHAFTRFVFPWRWKGRGAVLMSRARDEKGNVQPSRDEWKRLHASYAFNHYNAVQAWRVRDDGRVENTYA